MYRGSQAKEVRQAKAQALKEERAKRSIDEQIELLKSRPGNSSREMKRLQKLKEKDS